MHWPSFAVYRVAKATQQAPERLATGYLVRATARGDDLFVDLLLPANDGPPTFGQIVRMSMDGVEVEPLGESDASSPSGNISKRASAAIAASDCNAYVLLHCDDEPAYRLVAMPYGDD